MDEFTYHNTAAVRFPFVECDLEQLQRLARNAQDIVSLLEEAKKSVAAIGLFQERLSQNRAVRCTKQSVTATAAARYGPVQHVLNLRGLPVNVFVDLVTFLPLLDVKTVAGHPDALRKMTYHFSSRSLNPRWGTYYTYLTGCNPEWAKLFFEEVQLYSQTTRQTAESMPQDQPLTRTVMVGSSVQPTDLSVPQTGESCAPVRPPVAVGTGRNQHHGPSPPSFQSNNVGPDPDSGRWSKKVDFHLRALRAKEKAWGMDHPTTLHSVAELGRLYASQGYLVEAGDMYERALSGYEAAQGKDHSKTQETALARDSLQSRPA